MPDERTARLAKNEARFREINERVERDLEPIVDTPEERLPFVCECARRDYTEAIELLVAEYEAVRQDARRFIVVAGHEIPDVEDVVERHDRYFVIQKHADAWEIVEREDPRR